MEGDLPLAEIDNSWCLTPNVVTLRPGAFNTYPGRNSNTRKNGHGRRPESAMTEVAKSCVISTTCEGM